MNKVEEKNADADSPLNRVVMLGSCHTCRYHLEGESNLYARCLQYYNKGEAVERLRQGLIGRCEIYRSIEA